MRDFKIKKLKKGKWETVLTQEENCRKSVSGQMRCENPSGPFYQIEELYRLEKAIHDFRVDQYMLNALADAREN